MARAAKSPAFKGFSRELIRFFGALAQHNDRSWFEAHRSDYERLYAEPAKAFVAAMAPGLARLMPGFSVEPRIGGAIHRIHRDTRFSKDKTPYKTALMFGFHPAKGAPGFFLRIAPSGLGAGAGVFGFTPEQLAAYRQAAGDPVRGRALRRAVERVRKAGPYELPEPHYKRVPRGFDPDHPNAELLRQRSFFARSEIPLPAPLFGPKAVPFCLERFRELRSIHTWLVAALG